MTQPVNYFTFNIETMSKHTKSLNLDDRNIILKCEGKEHTFAPGAGECVCGKLSLDRIG